MKILAKIPVTLCAVLAVLCAVCATAAKVVAAKQKESALVLELKDGDGPCTVTHASTRHFGNLGQTVKWNFHSYCDPAETHTVTVGAFKQEKEKVSCPEAAPTGKTNELFEGVGESFGGARLIEATVKKDEKVKGNWTYCVYLDEKLAIDPRIMIED